MKLLSLNDKREFLDQVVDIYLQEWGWHFKDEWDIISKGDMKNDIQSE